MRTETQDKVKKTKAGRYVFIFIAAAIILSNTTLKDKIEGLFIKTDKTLEVITEGSWDLSEYKDVKIYEEGVAGYKDNKIVFYNFEGIELWNKSITYEDPLIHLGQERIYIGNGQLGEVSALSMSGEELWTYNLGEKIDHIIEKEEKLMVILARKERVQQINIVDIKGQLIANFVIENGVIINGSVSQNGEIYLVNTLDITQAPIKSKLNVFSLDGKLITEKTFDDEIILYSEILKNKNILVATDKKINYFGDNYKLLWNRDIYDTLKDTAISEDNDRIYLLTSKGGGTLEAITLDGRTEDEIALNGDFNKLYIKNKRIYLAGETQIKGLEGKESFLEYSSNEIVDSLSIYDDSFIFLTSDGIRVANKINKKKK